MCLLKQLNHHKVAPSILSADFVNLESEINKITAAGADLIHVDVMDGHFVPNLTIGMPVVAAIKPKSKIPLDVHLMIEKPEKYVEEFIQAGSDYLTIHVESTDDVQACLNKIRLLGAKPGITSRPGTAVDKMIPHLHLVDLVLVMTVEPGFGGQKFMTSQLEKIKELKKIREEKKLNYLIEVDGGINSETARLCWESGADILVAGSAVFNGLKAVENYKKNIDLLK
jgi:ribulose-phosphate 3-epimerase